jgi:hypothetical protein
VAQESIAVTYVYPCRGCPLRDGCEQKAVFAERAKAAAAISIKFQCDKLAAEIRPGRRIVITKPVRDYYHDGYTDGTIISGHEINATITEVYSGHQFRCTEDLINPHTDDRLVDINGDDHKFRFRKKQKPYRIIRFLDEPDRKVCEHGRVLLETCCDACDGDMCYCLDDFASKLDRMHPLGKPFMIDSDIDAAVPSVRAALFAAAVREGKTISELTAADIQIRPVPEHLL